MNVENSILPLERSLYFSFLSNLSEVALDDKIKTFFEDKIINPSNFPFYRMQQFILFYKLFY
jgi:hypothetical protein